jgi:selenocysteine lyase/cysteine desulfurase
MVDAIQGLGVFPVDVHKLEIDFLAADGHKWLLGPEGAGLLYVRRELIDRLRPTSVGWHSVKPGGTLAGSK